ncbi:GNAT family N-acetyltransferase [Pseudomonas huanghezhanensis]|uniref:GNAT family N-acetyltransferase n=1 Tax=Pseudomonas huanghezhanensis TaxID=3002903 RepID=UPI00228563EE|nr:GNAT family N-acetyltransferase [Pseudomonas sp. BSw22131]
MDQLTIVAPVSADIPEIIEFTLAARAELFPKLDGAGMPADLADFASVYLNGKGRFLLARDAGRIVACVGYLPYDSRFPHLAYPGLNVVEVVRLFVHPAYRRPGLATRLYEALKALAVADAVDVIYLHTHPFLPGAIDFWRKRGFDVIDIDADPVWQTTHMHSPL